MNKLVEHVEYLIRHNDCVIMPSCGAFVVGYTSARYDDAQQKFFPPTRSVSFNAELSHNDWLIADSIARRSKISQAEAHKLLASEIKNFKNELAANGGVTFGSLGRFIYQEKSTPIFEPSAGLCQFENYAMQPIAVVPVKQLAEAEANDDADAYVPKPMRKLPRLGLIALRAAASIALIFALGALLLAPVITRNDNWASFATEYFQSKQATPAPEEVEVSPDLHINIVVPQQEVEPMTQVSDAIQPEEQLTESEVTIEIATEDVATADAGEVVHAENKAAEEIRVNPADRYCLVVASLPTLKLAEQFIEEDGNKNLQIYVNGERYRVYAATGKTSANLQHLKNSTSLGERYPEAWVCRMN